MKVKLAVAAGKYNKRKVRRTQEKHLMRSIIIQTGIVINKTKKKKKKKNEYTFQQ
jgi:hypothetical protein